MNWKKYRLAIYFYNSSPFAMKCLLFLVLVATATNARLNINKRNVHNEYRMCVPEQLLDVCNQMAQQETKSPDRIICVPKQDRSECIQAVKDRKADFIVADPEDMLVAAQIPDQDFAVFAEVRARDLSEAEFRYECVVVIHKDLKLETIKDLKGLKSCHTGFGRTVGYEVPLIKLTNMGIIGNLSDPDLSQTENELKALSTLFSKSCVVGKWSPDPDINKKLKEKYKNLCALCEEPEKCDYPDNYSGYEGALRCLVHNAGDVAFTKDIFVRKYFGLSVGVVPSQPSKENPDDYAYLCPDGSRLPVRGPPCHWAARPWPGYVTNAATVKIIEKLQNKLSELYVIGNRDHAPWFENVLEISNLTFPKETTDIGVGDYLDKGNYTGVLERNYGPPFKTIKFCVLSELALKKCRTFSHAAFSRNIRPRFDCVQEKTHEGCFKAVRDGTADITNVDGSMVGTCQRDYNLKPIVSEIDANFGRSYFTVAVVRKDSPYKSFSDLRGVRSCHTGYESNAGYKAPLHTLIKLGLIKPDQCPYSTALAEFFSGGSCIPGANETANKLPREISDKFCSQCSGQGSAHCFRGFSEPYYKVGAFRCLTEGNADVTFVKHFAPIKYTDGNSTEAWAANLKSKDFELLCPNGGRMPIQQYEKCYLGRVPTTIIVTSNSKKAEDIDEIIRALIAASDIYSRRPDLFRLFGPFEGHHNLMFWDTTLRLEAVGEELGLVDEVDNMINAVEKCDNGYLKNKI